MFCLRCGRETENEQAFCLDCQKVMAAYPVDPNAVVQLPVRKQNALKKTARRRVTPEERVKRLRRRCRWISGLAVLFLIASIVLGIVFLRHLRNDRKPQPGQNYSAMETTEG